MGTRTHDVIKGRAKYVLILIVLLNMLYPITSSGSTISLIAFAALYAGLFIVGIIITSDSRAQITWSISIAVIWLIMNNNAQAGSPDYESGFGAQTIGIPAALIGRPPTDILLIAVGVNLVAAANDLVGMFLGLELIRIPSYLMLYLP